MTDEKTALYNILRGYQDGKFDPTSVCVGKLDENLTVVYDEVVKLLGSADKDRQIAVLTEALEHYADDMNWDECTIIDESERMSCDNGYIGSDQAGHIVAQKALAESKRIQEDK